MFRLSRADHPNHILITIEGQLAGDYILVAETACGEALSTGVPVTVFLKDVLEIDANGHAFLRKLALRQATLRASGVYLRHIVRSLQRGRDQRDGEVGS